MAVGHHPFILYPSSLAPRPRPLPSAILRPWPKSCTPSITFPSRGSIRRGRVSAWYLATRRSCGGGYCWGSARPCWAAGGDSLTSFECAAAEFRQVREEFGDAGHVRRATPGGGRRGGRFRQPAPRRIGGLRCPARPQRRAAVGPKAWPSTTRLYKAVEATGWWSIAAPRPAAAWPTAGRLGPAEPRRAVAGGRGRAAHRNVGPGNRPDRPGDSRGWPSRPAARSRATGTPIA